MFSRIEFILTETFMSLRRHPMMAFAAITCVAATLFVAGIVGLALLNANHAVDTALARVRFVVYFNREPETTRDEARAAYRRICQLEKVESAEFISREHAWAKLKKDDPEYVRVLEKNPLPDSVSVKAVDVTDIPALKKEINQWPEVHQVSDVPEVSTFLDRSREAIGKIGMGMGIILLLLSLVIIHHTIELTLYARRKEIHIMSLVGATPSTIALPFLLEGILYGLIGGGLAFGFLALLYNFLMLAMKNEYGASLLFNAELLNRGTLAILIAGVGLGLIGSAFSVVKYMRRPRSKMTNA